MATKKASKERQAIEPVAGYTPRAGAPMVDRKLHMHDPVLQYVTLCGIGLIIGRDANVASLGGPEISCMKCREILRKLVDSSLGVAWREAAAGAQ